jgi:hypothetical protein
MEVIECPETSVNGYQYMLRNIPEEQRLQLHLDRRLKSRKIIKLASEFGDSITENFDEKNKTYSTAERSSWQLKLAHIALNGRIT